MAAFLFILNLFPLHGFVLLIIMTKQESLNTECAGALQCKGEQTCTTLLV